MKAFSRVNVLLRKFPSEPSFASTLTRRTGHSGLAGTPYRPMDRFACWLIVASAFLVAVALFFIEGGAVLPWVMVAGPVSVGVACMIAKMVDRDWFSQTIALLYFTISVVVVLAFAFYG